MEGFDWDERYRTGDYVPRETPTALIADNIEWLPGGRALDVATGTGRNARFLAEHGYDVDAIDFSSEALSRAKELADEEGVVVNWIHADLAEYSFPENTYDLITVSFHYNLNLIPGFKDALTRGGLLLYEHHLRPARISDRGPSSNQYRFRSNDLLRACLDLTILEYQEFIHTYERGERAGQTAALTTVIARNGLTGDPWYPPEH